MTQTRWTIGAVARRFKVTLQTLRHYERRGLLTPLRENDMRLYDQQDIDRLEIILGQRKGGKSIASIVEFLNQVGLSIAFACAAMSPFASTAELIV